MNTSLLALYDPKADTKVSADASSFVLGAVILQRSECNLEWRAISFASRTMTDTDREGSPGFHVGLWEVFDVPVG